MRCWEKTGIGLAVAFGSGIVIADVETVHSEAVDILVHL